MPRILYVIRHGQTDWNATNKIQGATNTPLNDFGRAQAKRNGEILKGELSTPNEFQFVSSTLDRARETMEIIRGVLGLPKEAYQSDARLVEVNYGDWQGHTWQELRAENSTPIEQRFKDPWRTVPPSGESYEEASARILSWLDSTSGNMVIVTHGGIMRCIHGHFAGEDYLLRPRMDVPQDQILVIENDVMRWI